MNAQFKLEQAERLVAWPPVTLQLVPSSWPAYRQVPAERARGINLLAAVGSLSISIGAFSSFLLMSGNQAKPVERPVTVMRMLDLQPPSRAAPAPEPARLAARIAPAKPIPLPPTIAIPDVPVVSMAAPTPVATEVKSVEGAASTAPSPPSAPATGAGDLSSQMISAKAPRYPVESRRLMEQGVVILDVTLSIDGSVADVSIAQSSGFFRLDHAALWAVRRWRWSPMLQDGSPVTVRGTVTIPFVLRN